MFGFQGTPEQVKKAEIENLTEEQKKQSLERQETLEAGFKAGKELGHQKNRISLEEMAEIIKKDSEQLTIETNGFFGSSATTLNNVKIKEIVGNDIRITYGSDNMPKRLGLRDIKSIHDESSTECLWSDDNESYEDLKANKTK